MKKILAIVLTMGLALATNAKVVHVFYVDGVEEIYSSSQLGAIDFMPDGTVVVSAYDGTILSCRDGIQFQRVTVDDNEAVTNISTYTLQLPYVGQLSAFSRDVTRIDFLYPSHDPQGEPVTLSGSIIVPQNIMDGKTKSRGVLLTQRFTTINRDEIPTRGYLPSSAGLLANPLNPDYISIEVDFYGFGCSERFPQAFCSDIANGQASLDALIAGRRIMENMGISYGDLLFNVGYSSGGYDALSTLKAAQTIEGYEDIHFDKSFAGGGPYDLAEVYRQFVTIDTLYYLVGMPIFLSSLIENGYLDYSYDEVFTPLVADHIEDWILSKNYTTDQIKDSIGAGRTTSDILQPVYLDLTSPESMLLQTQLAQVSLNSPVWIPDLSERIYLYHSEYDEYIPVRIARNMIDFFLANGYTRGSEFSYANLQVGSSITRQGHQISGVEFFLHVIPCIKAWDWLHKGDNTLQSEEYYRHQLEEALGLNIPFEE